MCAMTRRESRLAWTVSTGWLHAQNKERRAGNSGFCCKVSALSDGMQMVVAAAVGPHKHCVIVVETLSKRNDTRAMSHVLSCRELELAFALIGMLCVRWLWDNIIKRAVSVRMHRRKKRRKISLASVYKGSMFHVSFTWGGVSSIVNWVVADAQWADGAVSSAFARNDRGTEMNVRMFRRPNATSRPVIIEDALYTVQTCRSRDCCVKRGYLDGSGAERRQVDDFEFLVCIGLTGSKIARDYRMFRGSKRY
ncbi:hypothetical protein BDU57DRAFT_593473 [Ampelomyces quisqualis]|uniref:Uncharacterized protein n=1 Tax=Ampelomyces quisqualis TaxID=50730 RepID=A0A6A5QYP5_AMPQU|nr:hypothetical protein BDU57DRAFT_593473 [Ampelomyces quisqualis]